MVQKSGATVNKRAGKGKNECILFRSRYIACPLCLLLLLTSTHAHAHIGIFYVSRIFIYSRSLSLDAATATRRKICSANFSEFQCDAMAMKTKLNEMKRCEAKRNEMHSSTAQYRQWPSKMSNDCVCAFVCATHKN